jgi:predicted SnoaL-like aldol condensation-catalyzing enzyme
MAWRSPCELPDVLPDHSRFRRRVISEFDETSTARDLGLVPPDENRRTAMTTQTPRQDIERIYRAWDEALGKRDLEASLSLYADDASIESPLVQHLLKQRDGIVQGKENLRKFITKVFETNPPQRKRFKQGFFTDGRVLTWEYPRASPEGEQMDLVEVMEIENGLIRRHRVYWGWYALNVLRDGHQ